MLAAMAPRCVELPVYSADQVALTGSVNVALNFPAESVLDLAIQYQVPLPCGRKMMSTSWPAWFRHVPE